MHSNPTINNDHDHDHNNKSNGLSSISPQDSTDFDPGEIVLADEPAAEAAGSENNPPDSFWVSHKNVTDWLNHNTFIERKASVKMVTGSRKFEPGQTRSNQRSVSFNNKPQATIIGFRQKPVHGSDGKSKQTDRSDHLRLFKNRSVPGKSSGGPVPEPRSPRVSCMGRVGSMRSRARRTGFWKKVKTAILNRVRTNKVR
ncbi:putative calcium/calmodulin-dependent protein kinase [Helianthus annuus]|nr:putative calcium/calmodulin-dependent protein kinase [Helianthus annuus]KAJ0868733.1 putative calcium/calmodulin-dependent protein kinase [Helianthus annuus]